MSRNWRQVRIFTHNFQGDWFHDLLWEVVRPWRQARPDDDYYFSRYISTLLGPDRDNADVGQVPLENILPAAFREQRMPGPVEHHWSVRIRFVEAPAAAPAPGAAVAAVVAAPAAPNAAVAPAVPAVPSPGPVEAALRAVLAQPQLQGRFWFPLFDTYDLANDLGGDRFSSIPQGNANARDARGELVARILRENCDLVMDSFSKAGANFQIQTNANGQNMIMGTAFQSVGHMLANVWWNYEGGHAGVWAVDTQRGIAKNI